MRPVVCSYCQTPYTQGPMAFFNSRDEGSPASQVCQCGYGQEAHGLINVFTMRPGITDHPYVPHGAWESDTFYCGCRGWE